MNIIIIIAQIEISIFNFHYYYYRYFVVVNIIIIQLTFTQIIKYIKDQYFIFPTHQYRELNLDAYAVV